MKLPLGVALSATLAATALHLLQGGPWIFPAFLSAIFAAALWVLPRLPWDTDRVNAAQVLLYLGLFVHGVWKDGIYAVPATLPYLPVLVLAAALLLGLRFALWVAAPGAALLLWTWTAGEPSFLEAVSLGNLFLTLALVCALCRKIWSLHAGLLLQLRERTLSLAAVLAQRRRLLGALFHDISNPLTAIQGILQLPQVGVPLEPQDQQRVQHMAARIKALMGPAATFYLVDTPVPAGGLQVVELRTLFADTLELFEDRLAAKKQRLSLDAPRLAVSGLPQVLLDSVLSNLLGNAHKFSPPGADLSLSAREQDGQVALCVRDHGPGIPADVLQSLERGGAVASRAGTAGEQGRGLGLILVKEHLARMGGRLELENLGAGGVEARAWLKKA